MFTAAPGPGQGAIGVPARIALASKGNHGPADGGSAMNIGSKCAVLAVFGLGIIISVAAQNKPSKSFGRSSAVHHTEVRHRSSRVAMPDDSKNLNKDLSKLENQTFKGVRPARRAPEKKVVLQTKTLNPQQDRRSNPPINFTYNGKNGGSASHNGGASHTASAPPKATPRMR